MISASKETPSARRYREDRFLTFNCYQFSRGVTAQRPRSRRWVSAEQCLCTHDPSKIFDATLLYTISFYETSDEEEVEEKKQSEKYPGIPPDRIGVFRDDGEATVYVPSDFLDALWAAAIAADGVLRSITLTVQTQGEGRWAVFATSFNEKIEEPFAVQFDKRSRPKASPPRSDPVVVELRGIRAQLRLRVWAGIAIIAIGVLVALWIANLWH